MLSIFWTDTGSNTEIPFPPQVSKGYKNCPNKLTKSIDVAVTLGDKKKNATSQEVTFLNNGLVFFVTPAVRNILQQITKQADFAVTLFLNSQ